MAAFSVEVPTGGALLAGLEPIEWAGYPPNTLLAVLPNGGTLTSGDEELHFLFTSDFDVEGTLPVLEGAPMPVLYRTNTRIVVNISNLSLGGPRRGEFIHNGNVKVPWMSTDPAVIAPEWVSYVAHALLKDKEIVTDTTVTYVSPTTYVGDYMNFTGAGTSYIDMNVNIAGLNNQVTTTPNFTILLEWQAPSILSTMRVADSDRDPAGDHAWYFQFHPAGVQLFMNNGNGFTTSNQRVLTWTIPSFSFVANTWYKIAINVTGMSTGNVCIDGSVLHPVTSTSQSQTQTDGTSTVSGILGGIWRSSGGFNYAQKIRSFAVFKQPLSTGQLVDLCNRPYQIYRKAP